MKVRALTSFGGTEYGHFPAGTVFELPDGVDWLAAGLVEPVVESEQETATVELPEKAVMPKPKAKKRKASK